MLDTDYIVRSDPVVRFFRELLGILQMVVGLYCVFFSHLFFSGGFLSTFIHLSLGKASPFTLESNITMLKPWKCKVPERIRYLVNN